jgi:hypothetical protein
MRVERLMEIDVEAEPRSDIFDPVAAPWHTVVVLAVIGALVFRGKLQADQMHAMANPDRITLYRRIILSEWLTLGLVLVGVWLRGSSLLTVMGNVGVPLASFSATPESGCCS